MTRQTEPADVAELVDAMLEFTAPITQALDHMVRAPGRPEVDEVVAILRGLLCDILEPLGKVMAPRDLRIATAVLEASVPMICEDLYLVPHPPARAAKDPRSAHRARRRPPRRRSRG